MSFKRNLETLADIDDAVRGRAFQRECEQFFDKYTADFEGAEMDGENLLEWTDIHNEYAKLVEEEINAAVGEGRVEDLCDDLADVVHSEEAGDYSEAIMLLTNFSDFLQFKQMMISRAEGGTQSTFGKLNGLGEDEDLGAMKGMDHISELLSDSKKMFEISQADGWKVVKSNDVFTFSSLQGYDGGSTTYSKTVLLVNLSVRDHTNLWCEYGTSREKWDTTFMTNTNVLKDYNTGKDTDDLNLLIDCSPVFLPKLMRWAMGVKDPMVFRIITQSLSGGAVAYVMVTWDVKLGAPDKKFEYQESGIIKPHPQDRDSSYLVSVAKIGNYTPQWLMAKVTESVMCKSVPGMAASYRKAYNL